MRNLFLAAAVGGAALMSSYGTAAAQVAIGVPGAGFYVGPTYYDDDDDNYSHRPRYYRGYRYNDENYGGHRQLRSDFNLCGRSAYYDGNACQPGRRP
jgi:hypothetical protein